MPFLASFCLTIIASQFQPYLLPAPLLGGLLALLPAIFYQGWRYPAWRALCLLVAGIIAGLVYSNGFAANRLQQVLLAQYEQQDIALLIRIDGSPVQRDRYLRTQAQVLQSPQPSLSRIQLNWYGGQQPQACETWQVTVRLKRPHGLRNPGSWSYRLYMLEQNIQAAGYVRSAQRVSEEANCLHHFRSRWHDYVAAQLPRADAAWVIALSTGDKALLSREQYRLMQATGINHLFVISGLHIGLTASVAYGLVLLLRRLGGGLLYNGDWRPFAALMGLLAAIAYTALADFVIPAQRSLIMVAVFFGGQIVGIHLPVWLRFWLAMALVLLLNPLAAMNIGFALSFVAVALLIITAQHIQRLHKAGGKLRLLIATQFYIAVGLMPLLLLFFQQISLSGPWINLFAIPVVSLIITPLILLALLCWALRGEDYGLLVLSQWLLEQLFRVIITVNDRFQAITGDWPALRLDSTDILLAALIGLLLMLPRSVPGKHAFAVLLLPALLCSQPRYPLLPGELSVQVLDVGQGLSVLVRTANHQLLYDTGAAWENSSMAEQVVMPVMAYYRLRHLDAVIISHFDNDHAGGWPYIQQTFAVHQWLAPGNQAPFSRCAAGQHWQWDDVTFTLLHPPADFSGKANDSSCVLLIQAAGKTVLLPGDISRRSEQQMLLFMQQQQLPQTIDVLVAPHHGSNSSSSHALLAHTDNAVVIFPAGYLNRYGHPHPQVVERYLPSAQALFNTALHGMVSIHIDSSGNVKASSFRQQARRYWDAVPGNHLEY